MDKEKNADETLLQKIRKRFSLQMATPDAIKARVTSLPKAKKEGQEKTDQLF